MVAEASALLKGDIFRGHTKWPVMIYTQCLVEDGNGNLLCHCLAKDTTCRSPLIVTAREDGTRELLSIQRPPGNFRMEVVHEGIPVTDNLYIVTDLTCNLRVGVVQKPWLREIWRDLWIVRDPEWSEICRARQDSRLGSLVRMLVTSLPSRYSVLDRERRIGKMHSAWRVARVKIGVDLQEDRERRFDRRLAIALLVLMLTR